MTELKALPHVWRTACVPRVETTLFACFEVASRGGEVNQSCSFTCPALFMSLRTMSWMAFTVYW